MKTVVFLFVLLALAAVPVAAGGRGEAGPVTAGGQAGGGQAPVLVETDLTKVAQIAHGSRIRTTSDGLLLIYDSSGDKKEYLYLDSSATRKRSVSAKLAGDGSTFALDGAGNICVFDLKSIPGAASDAPPKGFQRKYTIFSSDGKQLSTVDLGDIAWDQSNPWYATDIAVGEGGQFFLGTPKGIEAYDAKGKLRRLLGSFSCQAVATDGKGGLYGGATPCPATRECCRRSTRQAARRYGK